MAFLFLFVFAIVVFVWIIIRIPIKISLCIAEILPLVGATARDLLLYHVFGHAVTRATYDLDFAILVDSWEQFATVKQLFLDMPGFTDKGRNAQRLYYQSTGTSFETIIDIIPFGKLETTREQSLGHLTLAW